MKRRTVLTGLALYGAATTALAYEIERGDVERIAASITGNTIIVDWHGTWDFDAIQPALDAATDGDTIIVLPSANSPAGAYVENITFPAKAITLRSIHPQDPGIVAATVIDGDHLGSVVTFAAGTPRSAILDGFRIQGGHALFGGGIRCWSADPTIIRCVVADNYAEGQGGGISCGAGAAPAILHCDISSNPGGGLACDESNPIVAFCRLDGN